MNLQNSKFNKLNYEFLYYSQDPDLPCLNLLRCSKLVALHSIWNLRTNLFRKWMNNMSLKRIECQYFFQVSSFVQLQATKWWRSGVRWRWHSLCYGKMWRRLVRRNFSENRNFRNISRKLCSQSINVLKIYNCGFLR